MGKFFHKPKKNEKSDIVCFLEIRTHLNDWKFRRLGEVQPGSLENPPRVNEKSASAVKIGRAIPSLALSSAVTITAKNGVPGFLERFPSGGLQHG
jgi:hypothetical protein